MAEIERIVALFPLTAPVPLPGTVEGLVPLDDVPLEQEVLRNPDNPRTWRSYITHVEETNYKKRPQADDWLSPAAAELLGFMSDGEQRLALQRVVSIYERALAHFPTSYALWSAYLRTRSRFVLGEIRGGAEAARRRMLEASNRVLEMGPTLLDARRDEEAYDKWDYALDGTLGWREWRSLAAAYERALMWLPRMPRLWLEYLNMFIHPSCSPILSRTHARRTFDRALRTLPGSLHLRIWKIYLRWAEIVGGETALRVWRRYLAVDPSLSERFVHLLVDTPPTMRLADGHTNGIEPAEDEEEEDDDDTGDTTDRLVTSPRGKRTLEASKVLLALARAALDGVYTSPEGKSPYQLLTEWLELAEKQPQHIGLSRAAEDALGEESRADPSRYDQKDMRRLPLAHIVRTDGLSRYPDQAGRLWTGLATCWIQRGDLDAARDTFEEGMAQVVTVRDFTQVFDAYAETSENVLTFMMDELDEEEDREAREREIDERMAAFEALMERRPFLLSDVALRRNPNDVQEWSRRVALYSFDDAKVVETYSKAIETINARKATPGLHQLYLKFAQFYENGGSAGKPDVASARTVFEKAVKAPFRKVDDLAEVWCSWAEMEIRLGNYDEALSVMARAVSAPRDAKNVSYYDNSLPPQTRLFKSLKLWAFYTDLEESLGTVESTKRAFDRIMELKIANAQTIINYAAFLEDAAYYEEAFKVYERGVELFTYPVAFELWNVYLSKFLKRYGDTKLERARDMFEQALEKCPADLCKPLFLRYGQLEEEHGLMRKAMDIYRRATQAVSAKERYDMYLYYIAKAAANYGLVATRPIYEEAIEQLPDKQTADMCVRFAALERKLGEFERARAIFAHASQFCNPKTRPDFWQAWNDFEIESGTEDTFREMLRIKRSVKAQYDTELSNAAAAAKGMGEMPAPVPEDAMAAIEAANAEEDDDEQPQTVPSIAGAPAFVAATTVSRPDAARNAERIAGDGDDDDLL
ncbi:pre-mRNA-splicing factor syf1 [Malassezia cuniculi]|uniref:Pre-mRNA-splicing factor SYF1 n=1 Tax=Malassezia cuniculi TaxID=948313 RepID=A0AAF0J6H7_9BASI|nr:pre-mRNA-splicing factor syf1 [Malassezia cuniculi]